MNLYCDRYSVCQSYILDRGPDTENVARAKGWHLWKGTTLSGRGQEVILCASCVESGRRMLKDVEPLPGQYPIPQLEVIRMDNDI